MPFPAVILALALLPSFRAADAPTPAPGVPASSRPARVTVVRGAVRADSTRDPIPYAVVEVADTRWRVSADANGYYVLAGLAPGRYTLRASALGYADAEQPVDLRAGVDLQVDFALRRAPVGVGAISVRAAAPRTDAAAAPGSVRLAGETLRWVPALAEVDVLRAAQIAPSVTPVSDFSSALYVRGGAPDQTLVTLDGVPVFNPYHVGGLFGAFSADAVESVDVLPGALPATAGDRLSSVVDVRTRKGSRGDYHSRGGISLMSSRAAVDGPLPGGRGSFLVAARQTYVGLIGGGFTARGEGAMLPRSITPEFRDIVVSATHDLGRYGSLDLLLFADHEWFSIPRALERDIRFEWAWGRRVAALGWRQPIGASIVAEARAGYTGFRSRIATSWEDLTAVGGLVPTSHGDGDMGDAFASAQVTAHALRHVLTVGAQRDAYRMRYDADRVDDVPTGLWEEYVPRLHVDERPATTSLWAEDEWEPVDWLSLRAGVRALDAGQVGRVVGPRFGARLRLPAGFELSAGGGRYGQALHSIRAEEVVATNYMSYDLLRVAGADIGVARAEDAVVSLGWFGERTSVRVDAYTKRMEDLSVAPLPVDPSGSTDLITDSVVAGSGVARGLEISARHVRERGGVWLSYAFLDTYREVGGTRYTPRFQRRHLADLMVLFPLVEEIRVSTRATFGSGQPYTPTNGVMYDYVFLPGLGGIANVPAGATTLLADLNSARLPAYLRVDVGARTRLERKVFGRQTELWPYVQLINVADIRNVAAGREYAGAEKVSRTLQLPLTVTVGIEWSF